MAPAEGQFEPRSSLEDAEHRLEVGRLPNVNRPFVTFDHQRDLAGGIGVRTFDPVGGPRSHEQAAGADAEPEAQNLSRRVGHMDRSGDLGHRVLLVG